MTHRTCRCGALALVPALAMLAGCVEREIIITTEPFGAVVFDERNIPLSASPADKSFTYYGKYRFKIVKDGYETLIVDENIKAPWYEWLGVDFVSENVVPWTIRDIRRFHYVLQPSVVVPPEQALEQGKLLRARGQTIGTPLPESVVRSP
jgi:hypothetical protein